MKYGISIISQLILLGCPRQINGPCSEISKRGISAKTKIDANANANTLYDKVNTIQNKRNSLKTRSQEATVQAEQAMDELKSFCSEARKLVKIQFPKETWPEFEFRQGEYADRLRPIRLITRRQPYHPNRALKDQTTTGSLPVVGPFFCIPSPFILVLGSQFIQIFDDDDIRFYINNIFASQIM
jgi:outer membrane murein-binding lipoprotein Lpp